MSSALRVEITAEIIATFAKHHEDWDSPVREALAQLLDQPVALDADGEHGYVATIGDGAWVLVVDLPPAVNDFLDYRWENGGPGDPFTFELEVPAWVVALVAKAASIDDPAMAAQTADAHLAIALEQLQR